MIDKIIVACLNAVLIICSIPVNSEANWETTVKAEIFQGGEFPVHHSGMDSFRAGDIRYRFRTGLDGRVAEAYADPLNLAVRTQSKSFTTARVSGLARSLIHVQLTPEIVLPPELQRTEVHANFVLERFKDLKVDSPYQEQFAAAYSSVSVGLAGPGVGTKSEENLTYHLDSSVGGFVPVDLNKGFVRHKSGLFEMLSVDRGYERLEFSIPFDVDLTNGVFTTAFGSQVTATSTGGNISGDGSFESQSSMGLRIAPPPDFGNGLLVPHIFPDVSERLISPSTPTSAAAFAGQIARGTAMESLPVFLTLPDGRPLHELGIKVEYAFAVVPEPSTLICLVTGLATLVSYRRGKLSHV